MSFEITEFAKTGGPLTKQIWLAPDGSLRSDATACIMIAGRASRFRFDGMGELARKIGEMPESNALALGAMVTGVSDPAEVTTTRRLNGARCPDVIVRTQEYLTFPRGASAVALLDHDSKGMPPAVAGRIVALGGFWPAITSVVSELDRVARVSRASTSAGLFNGETGEQVQTSNGNCHVYIAVADGADVQRFLTTLHQRCWLAGLGWLMAGAAGQMLQRSIVDFTVGSPERLVFEGPPRLGMPLQQDPQMRQPLAVEGKLLDTAAECPPLSATEEIQFRELLEQERVRLRPEADQMRRRYISGTAQRLGVSERVIERRCDGVLRLETVLEFDDEDLAGTTVADVLSAPDKFIDETLADPIEGVQDGRGKAKVMRQGGSVVIHSFAHGLGTIYKLKWDKSAIEAAVRTATREDALRVLIDGIVHGDVDPVETEELLNIGVEITKIGKREINAVLKKAREGAEKARACEERQHQISAMRDHRPQMKAPRADAEWRPIVEAITEVLANSSDPEPPTRDPDGHLVMAWVRQVPRLHALTGAGEEAMPASEQLLITRLEEPLLAELIERHVGFVADDRSGVRLVHLDTRFVRHLAQRPGDRLPILTAVSTLPVVLDDGEIMRTNGLHRACGTIFRIPADVCAMLPDPGECGEAAMRSAIAFLRDEWLCDVPTSPEGKYILIALALTIIERVLLPERPAFFITSGVRGGGKTTVLNMISFAVLRQRASAAAWSFKVEERRKALFSYLLEGVPFLVWDNLPRGAAISCPHIERALTAETFSDRVLGVSGTSAPFASTIQAFTGNNVEPSGDLVSRSLRVVLAVSRLDPENRHFKHPDPFDWALKHRSRILGALYTILLGNPRRHSAPAHRDPAPTRFKPWWNLIGSAVEYAVRIDGNELSFEDLFVAGEQTDVQTSGIIAGVTLLHEAWPCKPFQASDAVRMAERGAINQQELNVERARAFRAALEQVHPKPLGKDLTPTIISWRLKAMCNVPVEIGTDTIMLRSRSDPGKHGTWFETEKVG